VKVERRILKEVNPSLFWPSSAAAEREMLDTARQLQTEIRLDPSEKEFWEALKGVQDIDISELKETYDKVRFLCPPSR
jgi:hypothetical protein